MKSPEFWEWFESYCVPRLRRGARRDDTFRKMFEHLDSFDRPVVIIETGCLEEEENWEGNGCSSIMFDRYIELHKGSALYSMDISPVHVELTRSMLKAPLSTVFCGDSVEILKKWGREPKIDLLYLDASHLDWNNETPAANHHLNELYAIMPALRDDTLVVVDDAPALLDDYPRMAVGGKGAFVAKHAAAIGADLKFHDYQIGWTKMTNRPVSSTDDIRELVSRARAHVDAGRLPQADEIYRCILVVAGKASWKALDSNARAEACAFFGNNAVDKGKLGNAIDWYREAVGSAPGWTDYRLCLIKALYRMGMWEAARAEAERATRISPEDHLTWKSLGDMELELEHAEEAVAAYDKEIALSPPEYLDCFLDRCAIAIDTEDYDTAEALCKKMMGTPNEKDAWHVMGMLHYRDGRHEEAIECYGKAIEMKARDLPQVHWNRSLALHSIGRYREGWKEHEWRQYCTHHRALSMPFRRFVLPKWEGQPAPALIHVHGEAGAGDNIVCARYLQMMVNDGYQVRYECLGTMEKMFKDSFPEVEIIERAKDFPGALGIKAFDYHCPIGSLPAIYKTDIDTVPWLGPYIKADPDMVKLFDGLLGQGNRRIGLCWSSGIRRKEGLWMERYGAYKSMHFDDVRPIVQANGAHFVSLQVGPEREEHKGQIDDLLSQDPSWDHTAALIENLDLVITVDTAVAHLAGAMGKPTWVMMQKDGSSWHFMCYRPGASWNEKSPWYPSVRVFRQHEFTKSDFGKKSWASVVQDVVQALKVF